MSKLYAEVTDRIVDLLKSGTLPWSGNFSAGGAVPVNATTEKPYRGINTLLFLTNVGRWKTMRFLTYKQAAAAGGKVRAGEKGSRIYFFKPITIEDSGGEEKKVPYLTHYTVFNVEQCEGLPEEVVVGPNIPVNHQTRCELADQFIRSTGANFIEGATETPMYRPGRDEIVVPPFDQFHERTSFYAAAFHELAHWTGHKDRLDRNLTHRFQEEAYAVEELVAELAAAFLCAEFGFDNTSNHAAYLQSWIKVLQNDVRAIFTAASAAQKAVDYLRGKITNDVQREAA